MCSKAVAVWQTVGEAVAGESVSPTFSLISQKEPLGSETILGGETIGGE